MTTNYIFFPLNYLPKRSSGVPPKKILIELNCHFSPIRKNALLLLEVKHDVSERMKFITSSILI